MQEQYGLEQVAAREEGGASSHSIGKKGSLPALVSISLALPENGLAEVFSLPHVIHICDRLLVAITLMNAVRSGYINECPLLYA